MHIRLCRSVLPKNICTQNRKRLLDIWKKACPFFANQENANEREGMKKGKYLDRHKAIDFYRSITSAPNLFFWQNSFQNISSIILKRVNAKNAFVQFVRFFCIRPYSVFSNSLLSIRLYTCCQK